MANYLYHITPDVNIPLIIKHGLKPRKKLPNPKCPRGLNTFGAKDRWEYVFLTDDVNFIIKKQCGVHWFNRKKCVILQINCLGLKSIQYINELGVEADHEFIYSRTINPKRIHKILTRREYERERKNIKRKIFI